MNITKLHLMVAGLALTHVILPFFEVSAQTATKPNPLAFVAAGTNGFTFDTGVLRGRLRADGKSKGLSEVVHIPTGTRLDSSMGLFGHYRVFTTNKRYGTGAWDWPSEAKLEANGSVAVRWPASDERPFELRATYRWAAPNALDVVTSVEAKTNLTNFESFLACYFTEGFTNSLVHVFEAPTKLGIAGFLAAEPTFGTWLAFPRDDAAMAIFRDGRWTRPPSPVEWVQMPRLGLPIGIRRNPVTGLTAVIMSPAGEAFAVCTPQQMEGHRSMYMSLFGHDLKPGETDIAHSRLVVGEKLTEAQAYAAYTTALNQFSGR